MEPEGCKYLFICCVHLRPVRQELVEIEVLSVETVESCRPLKKSEQFATENK